MSASVRRILVFADCLILAGIVFVVVKFAGTGAFAAADIRKFLHSLSRAGGIYALYAGALWLLSAELASLEVVYRPLLLRPFSKSK